MIRSAKKEEMAWVNSCYDEVGFVHSNFENETIAVAEHKNEKAELGRLVTIDPQNLELGGIYVFPSFRKLGLARRVVAFLLEKAPSYQTVYCIPFEHLSSFYEEFGFKRCKDLKKAPKQIVKKLSWCQKEYKEPTTLLVLEKKAELYYKKNASAKEENALLEGVIKEASRMGMGRIEPFSFFIKDKKNTILAGIKGITLYGCLYIDMLWVEPSYRKKGWGKNLMKAAESLARERKCTFAVLTTMDWEALPFYQKEGYQIEYTREGYEKNSRMYALKKNL